MSQSINLAAFGLLAIILLRAIYTTISFAYKSRTHGCSRPPRRRNLDLLLGIDYFWESLKPSRTGLQMPILQRRLQERNMTYCESSLFGSYTIHTADPRNTRAFYSSDFAKWGVAPFRREGFRPFIGVGLISTDGPAWQHSRNLMKPFFYKPRINDLGPFEEDLQLLIEKLPKNGEPVDLHPLFVEFTFDSSSRFSLGQSMGRLSGVEPEGLPVPVKEYGAAFDKATKSLALRMLLGPLKVLLPASMTTDAYATVHRQADYFVDRALKGLDDPKADRLHEKHSVINATTQQTKDPYLVRNQSLNLIIASKEPLGAFILNTLFALSRRPDIWERLRQEVKDLPRDRALAIDDIDELELVGKIRKEVNRLCPTFHRLSKTAVEDTVLPAGGGPNGEDPIFCPKGTITAIDNYTLHHRESVFGPNPDEFNPDRWDHIKPGLWDYLPFGGGPRSCMGRQKALAEVGCVLVRFAQRFKRLESKDNRPYTGVNIFVTTNKNGVHVGLVEE